MFYRDKKQLNVVVMNFKNSSFYVQRVRLIVRFRQEIDFKIDFIKLCKTKLNTINLWSKRVRKIESNRDFWSEIEKTISLQRVMNRQLRAFRDFCRIYIDDIMSFFKIFNDHVDHLRKLFSKLIKLRIILSVKKTFFNYFNITLLKQKIDVFDLSITKKRIVVVKTIRFFKNFKTLEIYLDLTNYQKNKMTWYTQKAKFLQ